MQSIGVAAAGRGEAVERKSPNKHTHIHIIRPPLVRSIQPSAFASHQPKQPLPAALLLPLKLPAAPQTKSAGGWHMPGPSRLLTPVARSVFPHRREMAELISVAAGSSGNARQGGRKSVF